MKIRLKSESEYALKVRHTWSIKPFSRIQQSKKRDRRKSPTERLKEVME